MDERGGSHRAGAGSGAGVGGVWAEAADAFRSWVGGERAGIDRLVVVMNPVLWHVVRAYRLDEPEARDVVQETWMRLLNRHDQIADPQAVSAWLTTTARREAWRVSHRANRDITVEAGDLDDRIAPSRSAEDAAVLRHEHSALWRGVQSLTERCQRLLRIIAFDERPDYARIAGELGMAVGSIGPTRSRCLDKLRSALRAEAVS